MLQNKNYTELYWTLVLLLLIPIWIGLAPVWYAWYCEPDNCQWLKWLYRLLDGRWLVNVPLCLIMIYVTYSLCRSIWKDNNFRIYRLIIISLGLVALYVGCKVEYAKVLGWLDYRQFFTILLVALLLIMGIKLILLLKQWLLSTRIENYITFLKKDNDTHEKEDKPKGFSDTKTVKSDIPDSLKNYASEIVERLLVTNIKDEAFAFGITGEWGVGKTMFLSILKQTIRDRAEIVDFNPWMCSSPEQVTRDFFASLRHQLAPKYSTLSKSIKEYAQHVNSVSLSPHSIVSLGFILPINQESLYSRKRTLSEKFAKLPKPVVVIIDDVDRLERDEVFEVLRLIRNTADLSNVIYIVAYDKEYVTSVLEEKNIKDASAYLEKIFPVEVHLPKVEDHLIWSILRDEIESQCSFGNRFTAGLFAYFNSDDKELILSVLDNYRRAKRFARAFMLNMGYVYQHSRNELKIKDVFWLELLQMYDKKTYDVLADEPGKLLYSNGERFLIKDGVSRSANAKDEHKFDGKPFWRAQTPKILEKMFGNYIKTIRQSICFTENYEKFFTLSVSTFRLSIKEMNDLFADDKNPDEVVTTWIEGGKYFSSIAYQFKQVNVNKIDDNKLKNYLHGIMAFSMLIAPYRSKYVWEVKNMLRCDCYVKGVDKKAHDFMIEWLEGKLNDEKSLLGLSLLLNRLFDTEVVSQDEYMEDVPPLVIRNKEVEILLTRAIKAYLKNHEELTAIDLMKDKGPLHDIFKSCCVCVKDAMETDNWCEYKQVAFDVVIGHFSQKETKPTYEEYEKALGNLFNEEPPKFDDQYEENQYWAYATEAYENNMQEYFGSGYDRKEGGKLAEFKMKCFVEESSKNMK